MGWKRLLGTRTATFVVDVLAAMLLVVAVYYFLFLEAINQVINLIEKLSNGLS